MLGRAGKFLVIVTLVLTTGLHWAALQTVAWSLMLADNIRTESVGLAVTHTFDGMHPCCLCKAIAKAKKSEQKNEFKISAIRLEFVPFAGKIYLPPPAPREFASPVNTFFATVTHPPLVPPPRNHQVC